MKNMTKRIFATVFIAAVICMGCFIFILLEMDKITGRYNDLLEGYVENRRIMSEISQQMYNIQALIAGHVVDTDREGQKQYEEKIEQAEQQIQELFSQFETRLSEETEKELFHQVTDSYNAFDSQMKIAMKFSRQGAVKSAEYYVCTVMNQYLETANEAFDTYYERTKIVVEQAKKEMKEDLARVRIWRNFAVGVMSCVLLVCLVVVYFSGRKILNRQRLESDENNEKIMDMQYKTIVGMANLIESRDGETGEHVKRTSDYAGMLAEELSKEGAYQDDISVKYMENLWKAAPLHDIGKIMISDAILQKPGKLTKEEFDKMKCHASEGGKIIDNTLEAIDDKEYLEMAHKVARYHHEKWDGTGYPEGLKGEEIPLCARIMAVADVFDALISKRCYKEAMPLDEAYDIIRESSGSHFDPVVVEAFLKIRPKVEAYIRREEEKAEN